MSEERDTTVRIYAGPYWAWAQIFETLRLDMQSSAFDPALREEIRKAYSAVHLMLTSDLPSNPPTRTGKTSSCKKKNSKRRTKPS